MPNSELKKKAIKWLNREVGEDWELESLDYMVRFSTLERAEARREAIRECIQVVWANTVSNLADPSYLCGYQAAIRDGEAALRSKLAAPEKEETTK